MPLALSTAPLLIAEIVRCNGVVTATIAGHGFTGVHVGQSLRVAGVNDTSFNGNNFTISRVPDGNTLQWLQTAPDNHIGRSGGAISVG